MSKIMSLHFLCVRSFLTENQFCLIQRIKQVLPAELNLRHFINLIKTGMV